MTIFPTTTRWITYEGHELNVTIHIDGTTNVHYPALIEATVKLFVYVAKLVKEGKETVAWPEGAPLTPEDGIAHKHKESDFYPMVESRVVVWDKAMHLTVHSHNSAQDALDAHNAMEQGIARLGAKNVAPATAQQPAQNSAQQTTRRVGDEPPLVENAKAAKLLIGQEVKMAIAAVSKVYTPKGAEEYQLFGKYGGAVGKFPELRVYADNEVAINLGIVNFLNALPLKSGDAPVTHNLIATVKVAAKGGKVNLYVNHLETADGTIHSEQIAGFGDPEAPH